MSTHDTCKDFTFDYQRFTFIFFTFVKAMVIYFNIVPEFKRKQNESRNRKPNQIFRQGLQGQTNQHRRILLTTYTAT